MRDRVEQAILDDVKRHESGCWTWQGPNICKVVRILAELTGDALPAGRKMYRMPECTLAGADCVNPAHVGTSEDYMFHMRHKHNGGDQYTQDDRRFLCHLGILLEAADEK